MTALPIDPVLSAVPQTGPARRRPIAGHGSFAGVLAVAAGLRVVTMLAHRPARLYYGDSYAYLAFANHPRPMWGFQPSGYGMMLWLLRPFHSITLVAGVQHALGGCAGLIVYAVLRRRSIPAWTATLAAVPVLFDGQMLQLEHAVLSDTLFLFLVVAAFAVLMWSPGLSVRAGAGAGVLLAAAAVTRTIALPVLAVVLLCLAARRVGIRPLAAAAVAAALPLALYASWYASVHGRFTLAGGDGVALWARTMTFADCHEIRPPAAQAGLCPNGARQDAAAEYVWAPTSPINQRAWDNDLARSFALRAIAAQPLDYASDVAHDVSLAFRWTPARHPRRVTPAFGFREGRWPVHPQGVSRLAAYDPGVRDMHTVTPYATFLRVYQYPAYLRGPFLAAILLLGLRRRALLPWAGAACLLVAPVAVLDFDHRYVLPAVPLACLAAALAVTPGTGHGP